MNRLAPGSATAGNLRKKGAAPSLVLPLYCGDSRIRTGDPLLAKQVLYQLSYTPGRWLRAKIVSKRKLASTHGSQTKKPVWWPASGRDWQS